MANKRMFSLTIIDSDAFLDMPTSSGVEQAEKTVIKL